MLETFSRIFIGVLSWLEELTGEKVEVLHIVGGGSQNALLNQFAANACGIPVVAGPVEATALGNVLLQARATGSIASLSEIREVVRNSHVLQTYEPTDQANWQTASQRFQALLSAPK